MRDEEAMLTSIQRIDETLYLIEICNGAGTKFVTALEICNGVVPR